MQFYLNGYRPGDPLTAAPDPTAAETMAGGLPEEVDVLIVGSGPAGLVLAAQLSALKRSGPNSLAIYMRNVRLRLYSQAQRIIMEVKE